MSDSNGAHVLNEGDHDLLIEVRLVRRNGAEVGRWTVNAFSPFSWEAPPGWEPVEVRAVEHGQRWRRLNNFLYMPNIERSDDGALVSTRVAASEGA